MTRIDIDAAMVKAQIAALIAAHPELVEDIDLLSDTLEGETDLYVIAGRLLEGIQDAKMMVGAIKEREKDLSARRARFEAREASVKKLLFGLMQAAKQLSIRLPAATLSIGAGRDSVKITDENLLDQGFYRVERVPLLFEISAELKAGHKVHGAVLVAGSPNLTIRTK